jgi:hypothetical protein
MWVSPVTLQVIETGVNGCDSAQATQNVAVAADPDAVAIPALDGVGLGLLAALVALGGALVLGRRLS